MTYSLTELTIVFPLSLLTSMLALPHSLHGTMPFMF